MMKKFTKGSLARFLGSVVLVLILLGTVDLGEIISTFKKFHLWVYLASFLIFLANKLAATHRWKLLLNAQNLEAPFWDLYKVSLFGVIFNRLLPSTIGGDSVRILWLIKGQPEKKAVSVVATLADRVLGLLALVVIVFATLPFNKLLDEQYRLMGFAFLGAFLALLVVLLWARTSWLVSIVRKLMFTDRLLSVYEQLISVLQVYKNSQRALLSAFLLSLLVQSINVLNQYLRFVSIGVFVPISFLFLAIPITTLITTIPITIGGVGLRELSLINLLGLIGITSSEVISYTLVGYSTLLVLGIGLAVYNIFERPLSNLRGKKNRIPANRE